MSRYVKVQGQHFTPWTGVFKELLDFRTVVGNIIHMRNCRRMTFFYLTEGCWFPFKSWQKQMMRKSTLIEITHKYPLHMTAVPILNPTQPLYNGIISLEGFPGSAQIGKVKLIPTTIPHTDYGQKLYHELFNKLQRWERWSYERGVYRTKYFQLLCVHQAPYIPWQNQLAEHPESSASQQILCSSSLENLIKVWSTPVLGLGAIFNSIRVYHFQSDTDSLEACTVLWLDGIPPCFLSWVTTSTAAA